MFSAYVLVTAVTAVANTFSATCDLVRYEQVAAGMARAGVPESWMTMLGALKMAGALGVLVGIVVPALGLAGVFLALAAGSLVTRLAV